VPRTTETGPGRSTPTPSAAAAWSPAPLARDVERVEELVAPAPVGDVEEERSGRVGDVDRALARQPEADIVLRQADPRDVGVHLHQLVPAEPEELRRGEPRERAIPGQRDQPLEPDQLLDLRALGRGALVVPEDRRPQDAVMGVERDEPVHLAGEADRRGFSTELGERLLARAPPLVRVLLDPTRPRCRERVRRFGARDDVATGGDPQRLHARRPDVEADEDRLRRHAGSGARSGALALDDAASRVDAVE
jgi:hypothetical protein